MFFSSFNLNNYKFLLNCTQLVISFNLYLTLNCNYNIEENSKPLYYWRTRSYHKLIMTMNNPKINNNWIVIFVVVEAEIERSRKSKLAWARLSSDSETLFFSSIVLITDRTGRTDWLTIESSMQSHLSSQLRQLNQ